MRKFMFFAAILLVIGLSVPASAQTSGAGAGGRNAHSIGGFIQDVSRRPVSNLYVELMDDVNSVIGRARTDGTGRYVFNGLSQGTFQVRVVTAGTNFVSQTARVELISFSANGGGRVYEEKSFYLKTVDEEKGSLSAAANTVVYRQDVPDAALKVYEEAIRKLDDPQNFDAGVEGLKKAIELFPTYYMALERLGSEYVKKNQFAPAMELLNKAIEVNPKGFMSLYALGIAQYNLKQMDNAVDSLKKSVALAPNSANSQLWLGIALFRSGKQAEAEEPLKRAYQLAGKQVPDVHMYLAQIYSNLKPTPKYKEAADELELFLKEVPDAKNAEQLKGIIKSLREKAK
jgi:tetratricopeptide (TPR) repeat protein